LQNFPVLIITVWLINLALQELIRTRKKRNLLDLSGQIEFSPDYDYKALRENRNVSG
jgi:hypothetical protein